MAVLRNILLVLLPFSIAAAQEPVTRGITGTNPYYEEGDWISYSDCRYINSIALGERYTYFGTSGGITRYNFYTDKWDFPFTTSNGLADNLIYVVAFDFSTGYLWCAGNWGVSFYEPTSRRWENIYNEELGIPDHERITSIGVGQHYLWLDSGKSILRGDKLTGIFSPPPPDQSQMLFDENIKWYGKRGLQGEEFPQLVMSANYFFFPQGNESYIEDINLRRFNLSYYLWDQWSNLWIGTWGLGAGLARLRTHRLNLLNFGLMGKDVHALAFDGEWLWIGGMNGFALLGGITRWNRNSGCWEYFESRYTRGLTSAEITAVVPGPDWVWFGTSQGLTGYNKEKNSWRTLTTFSGLSHNRVYDLILDGDFLWIATESGIDRLHLATVSTDSIVVERIDEQNLRNVAVADLELQRNLLWAATEHGVYVYDTLKKSGGFYSGGEGRLGSVSIIDCYENEIWFGGLDGVEIYDVEKKKWLGLPTRRFFSGQQVNCILATKDAVWVGTNYGVHKYNRKKSYWRSFTTADGLIDNEVNTILLDGDYIWFGTQQGLTRFYWNDPYRID